MSWRLANKCEGKMQFRNEENRVGADEVAEKLNFKNIT